jgi:hypothetical protein
MYYSSKYVLLLNANLNDGHLVKVDSCALEIIGNHRVAVSTSYYSGYIRGETKTLLG